jgi:hypothetical protein
LPEKILAQNTEVTLVTTEQNVIATPVLLFLYYAVTEYIYKKRNKQTNREQSFFLEALFSKA